MDPFKKDDRVRVYDATRSFSMFSKDRVALIAALCIGKIVPMSSNCFVCR